MKTEIINLILGITGMLFLLAGLVYFKVTLLTIKYFINF